MSDTVSPSIHGEKMADLEEMVENVKKTLFISLVEELRVCADEIRADEKKLRSSRAHRRHVVENMSRVANMIDGYGRLVSGDDLTEIEKAYNMREQALGSLSSFAEIVKALESRGGF